MDLVNVNSKGVFVDTAQPHLKENFFMMQLAFDLYTQLHPELQQMAQHSLVDLLKPEFSTPVLMAYFLKDAKVNINIHLHK
uniref:hypothetical protein n=2 Tax=Photobacterium leiognathi TaxID=553611 RepID=UPI003B96938C